MVTWPYGTTPASNGHAGVSPRWRRKSSAAGRATSAAGPAPAGAGVRESMKISGSR